MAKLSYKKRILPDAGKFLCAIIQANEVENRFYDPKKQGSQKTRIEWVFSYVDKPGMEIRCWSGTTLSSYKGKKSKALQIIEASLSKQLSEEEKESFNDTDVLLGKRLYLTIKHEKNEDGEIYAKIIDFENESTTPF